MFPPPFAGVFLISNHHSYSPSYSLFRRCDHPAAPVHIVVVRMRPSSGIRWSAERAGTFSPLPRTHLPLDELQEEARIRTHIVGKLILFQMDILDYNLGYLYVWFSAPVASQTAYEHARDLGASCLYVSLYCRGLCPRIFISLWIPDCVNERTPRASSL